LILPSGNAILKRVLLPTYLIVRKHALILTLEGLLSPCHRLLLLEYGHIGGGTEGHDVQEDITHNSQIMLCAALALDGELLGRKPVIYP
jgi:hypothetical protein